MQIKPLTIGFLALVVFSSCSVLKGTKATAPTTVKTVTKTPVKREFLNGIEVTPGYDDKQSPRSTEIVVKKDPYVKKESPARSVTRTEQVQGNIENANLLQLKYAIATDATVEKLTNIPLLEVIDKWWGTKYCMGGNTDSCIDCSAFSQLLIQQVYQQTLMRTAQEQYNQSERVELEELREGDLVFFNTAGRDISHVGVYMLNNKFVHAATSGGVMISDLNDKYWQPRYRGAGRVGRG